MVERSEMYSAFMAGYKDLLEGQKLALAQLAHQGAMELIIRKRMLVVAEILNNLMDDDDKKLADTYRRTRLEIAMLQDLLHFFANVAQDVAQNIIEGDNQ